MTKYLTISIISFLIISCGDKKINCEFPNYLEVRENNLKLSKLADRKLRDISELINNDILRYRNEKWNPQRLLDKDIYFSLTENNKSFVIESAYFSDLKGSDHSFSFINFLPIKNIDSITLTKISSDFYTRPASYVTFLNRFDNPKAFQFKTIKNGKVTSCGYDSSVTIDMGWDEAIKLKEAFEKFINKVQ